MTGLIWSAASASARLSVGFLIFAVLARQISTGEFGVVAYFYTYSIVLSLFLDYGFNLRLSRDAVMGGEIRDRAVTEALAVKILHFIVAAIIFGVWQIGDEHFLLGVSFLLAAFLNILGSTLFPLLRGENKFREETFHVVVNNILTFAVFVILVVDADTAVLAFPAALIVGKGYLTARFFLFQRRYQLSFPRMRDYARGATQSFTFFVHALAGYLFWNVDTLFLKEYVDFDVVGRYQAAIRLLIGLTFATDVLSNFFIPHIMNNGFDDDGRPRLGYHAKLFSVLTVGAVIVAVIGWNVFHLGMVPIFGSDYVLDGIVLGALSAVVFLRYFGVYFGMLLTILNAQVYRMYGGLLGTVAVMVMLYRYVPDLGMTGAAIANLGAHVVVNVFYVVVGAVLLRRLYAVAR